MKKISTFKRAWIFANIHLSIKDKVLEFVLNIILKHLQPISDLSHYLIIDTSKLDDENFDESLYLFEKSL